MWFNLLVCNTANVVPVRIGSDASGVNEDIDIVTTMSLAENCMLAVPKEPYTIESTFANASNPLRDLTNQISRRSSEFASRCNNSGIWFYVILKNIN